MHWELCQAFAKSSTIDVDAQASVRLDVGVEFFEDCGPFFNQYLTLMNIDSILC